MNQTFGGCFEFPWECGSTHWELGCKGPWPLKNDLQASAFQVCVTFSMQEVGNAIFLQGMKGG